MFMITALIMNTTFARFYVRVDILLTSANHFHDCMIPHRKEYVCPKVYVNSATFYQDAWTEPTLWAVIYMIVSGIEYASFYDFSIWF